jgi:hypothetical protein
MAHFNWFCTTIEPIDNCLVVQLTTAKPGPTMLKFRTTPSVLQVKEEIHKRFNKSKTLACAARDIKLFPPNTDFGSSPKYRYRMLGDLDESILVDPVRLDITKATPLFYFPKPGTERVVHVPYLLGV